MMPLISFLSALLISTAAIPAIRKLGIRKNLISRPRSDRWNRGVVPLLGGVGIFLGMAASILLTGFDVIAAHPGILAGALLMFLLGLWDDARELPPPVKLTAQIMISLVVVFSGYRTGFFSSELLNILITVAWLVGITNALNLVDNMDGLAGGLSLIAAAFMGFFFWRNPADAELVIIIAALSGGLLGFLWFNFPPARIFMGDSGSLFIGFTLASLAIARSPQASNVFAVLGVPALLFALPILDTTFVTITRLMRGQSPVRGGRDHTSHRLVAFGLTERQTVGLLYGIALLSGSAAALVESFDYTLSLVLIPILLVSFSILAAYLSRLKVVESDASEGLFSIVFQQIAIRRRLLEIILDFFLVSIAYYLATLTRSGFTMPEPAFDLFVQNLPIVIGSVYVVFFIMGIYQGLWQFIGMRDLVRLGGAIFLAAALSSALIWLLFPRSAFSFGIQFLLTVYLFIGASGSRSSFKLLDEIGQHQQAASRSGSARVLLYAANEPGELTLRWLSTSTDSAYTVVGFLDDDPYLRGRRIHDVEVLGAPEDAEVILRETGADGIIVAPLPGVKSQVELLRKACSQTGAWIREVQVRFEQI